MPMLGRLLLLFRVVAFVIGTGCTALGTLFLTGAASGPLPRALSVAGLGIGMLAIGTAYLEFARSARVSAAGSYAALATVWLVESRVRRAAGRTR